MKIDDKNVCNIVSDLLPLYADDACTEESKQIVEEHIKECADCARTLEAMKEPVEITDARNMALELTEIKFLKAFKKASRKVKIKVDLIILLVFLLITPLCILTVHQFDGSGICFTNFDDIKAATEVMETWKTSGFEAVLDAMEPTDLYEYLCRDNHEFTRNPYENYFTMNVDGTTCYLYNYTGSYESRDARLDDEEFMSDFWYSLIVNTEWDYIIPADIYENLEAKYGNDFYLERYRNYDPDYHNKPKKVSTELGDYYYNKGFNDFPIDPFKTPDFRERISDYYDLEEFFYAVERSVVLTPELYNYYCKVYDEVYKWETEYAEYYQNLGYDKFKAQWKKKLSDYLTGCEKQGVKLIDYKYESAYFYQSILNKSYWDITFEVRFSDGAKGYISISRPCDQYRLSYCRALSTEPDKTQYFFLKLEHIISADYYGSMSFEEEWEAYY